MGVLISINRDGESFNLELMKMITYTADFQTAANKMDGTCGEYLSMSQKSFGLLECSIICFHSQTYVRVIHLVLSDAIKSSVIIQRIRIIILAKI